MPTPTQYVSRIESVNRSIKRQIEGLTHAGSTLDDYLLFYVVYHEGYHLGQIEILRELALA